MHHGFRMAANPPYAVHGLIYYADGRENHPACPAETCAKNVRLWICDLEARFGDHWTEIDKIGAAKQYTLSSAFDRICNTVRREAYVWSEVKQHLLLVFNAGNEDKTYYEGKAKLVTARHRTGGTIPQFWNRLNDITPLLKRIILKSNPGLKTT